VAAADALASAAAFFLVGAEPFPLPPEGRMELGMFSVSLAVKDLGVSRAFYEKLGFRVTGGDEEHYVIMANGTTVIGLFEGMFEKNILTFNPGLAATPEMTLESCRLEEFTDVREIQRTLRERGIELTETADEDSEGAGHVTLSDPDGNPILIDQFF